MRKLKHQSGIVALLTTIIVGILLITITTSSIVLMSGELRSATDFDNSVKAYYAAESGVEDAIAEIRRRVESGFSIQEKNTCGGSYGTSNPSLSADGSVSYTCQIITTTQNQLTAELKAEDSTQLDLTGLTGYTQLRLQWNQGGTSDPQTWSAIPPTFPSSAPWPYPAVMEVTVINYDSTITNPSDTAQLNSRTLVLKPTDGAFGTTSVGINATAKPATVNCGQPVGANYSCSLLLTGFTPSATRHYIIKLAARYNKTNYNIQALSSTGGVVAIPNTQLAIDVTGKSGDVFRRVLTKAPLSSQAPHPYVLLGGDAICKVLNVTAAGADTETGCN